MSAQDIPSHSDILVIGGGPAGSYAACALVREGHQVTVLERDHFPRYHIGESMLPSCRPFMRFIGVEQKVIDFGFCIKVGAALKFDHNKREGYTDFIKEHPGNAAWNVTRADFDDILLKHAAENGAKVFEGTGVTSISFSAENPEQPVSVDWKSDTGATGTTTFKYLVDASGRNGLMSTRYLKNRKFNKALRNVAYWGYWTGQDMYAPGTHRENATWLESLTDETGWGWFIPLAGKVSVGVVMRETFSKEKKAAAGLTGPEGNAKHYFNQLKFVPGVQKLLNKATFQGEVMSAGDYSYSAPVHSGPNFRIVGDAGAFIDPFFSSGVHLAFNGALTAASSISAAIRGECTEEEAGRFHTERVGTSYTRYMMVVLAAYRQLTSQNEPVLSDVDEDNYDRAFEFIKPVIQGTADTDPTITEEKLQATLDFCEHAMAVTDPEMYEEVSKRIDPKYMANDGPVLSIEQAREIANGDEEVEMVLRRIQGRKAVESLYWEPNFRGEKFAGLSIRMERGNLGLNRNSAQPVAA